MNITKERMQEIVKQYDDGKHDLFNWCEEYKQFVYDGVGGNVTQIVDFSLKNSYENDNAPITYEDLQEAIAKTITPQRIVNRYNENCEKGKEVNSIDDIDEETKEEIENELKAIEPYEYYIVSDPLLYRLEQEGEIILDTNIWGRCCTGQSITLDNVVIKAFISLLRDNI